MIQKPDRSTYTPLDFRTWNETGALELTPKFQRRAVWKTPARSYLIDTLIKGMPVPPIYLRVTQNEERTRTVRQVVDGQQRLRAVLSYMDDEFALTKSVSPEYGGKRYSQLPANVRQQISDYSFICEVFQSISDEDVLAIFARMNTYSIRLNKQELRNGQFFGLFKQTAYALAYDHLEFWRRNKIFTETSIARMQEVEMTSEIMIALIAGQQDKKESIDKFYAEYDESFTEREKIVNRFRSIIDNISEALGDDLKDTEFTRWPLFYTLCCVVGHRLFGLPQERLTTPKKGHLTKAEREGLRDAVYKLSDLIVSASSDEPLSEAALTFYTATIRQADNVKPRHIRFSALYKRAFD
jgi:hypothetical protein